MAIWGALIGAGASLLGGRRQSRDRQREIEQNTKLQDPVYRRERLEAAGLNPATHFGATGGSVSPGYAPMMGQAIADAGALLASGIDSQQHLRLEKTRLEQEKAALDKALKSTVIRPTVGGIYQQRRQNDPLEVDRRNTGSASVDSDSDLVSDADRVSHGFGDAVETKAPGRSLEVAPNTSGPGITEINNSYTGPIAVPGSDGEPWGIDELATGLVFGIPQVTYNAGKRLGNYLDEVRFRKKFSRMAKRQSETSSGARRKWSKLQRHRGMTHAQ